MALRSVSIIGIEAKAITMPQGKGKLSFDVAHEPAIWNLIEDALICIFSINVGIAQKQDDQLIVLATMSLTLRSEYALGEAFSRDEDAHLVPDYAGIVGRLHVWPYFRAEIQALTGKLGLPTLTLPIVMSGQMATLPVKEFGEVSEKRPSKPPSAPKKAPPVRKAKAR